ncbi:uncharacterized protein LOC127266524 [Andrographis paniculata]|uniref:uncharacterized protein LOC127266524 n=1 Tax=Andrographis paniculata TaxID=175694 RepID=UPI0021E93248|nr:uncharacterized protein LOC127266524 [Andrographis paniculata]XP_051152742.1 uncharacterized protein LOC127266524 [Andrographis paniculata]
MEGGWIGLNDGALGGFVNNPALMEALVDILICAVPIWLAVMIGLLIGWSWRPRWTGLVFLGFRSKFRFVWTLPPGLGARRFWLAFTALSAFSLCRGLWFRSRGKSRKLEKSAAAAAEEEELIDQASSSDSEPVAAGHESLGDDDVNPRDIRLVRGAADSETANVTEKDLEHLLSFLDGKDGKITWQNMMERSTSNMTYQAWRHEPENGPIVLRSKTIFEDATPELVRDFFWDDEFRPKWDPMLYHVKILEECPNTGMMIIHWIKKFPFFCSDREYIIGRRIWEEGKTYYCVTKGVPYPSLPRRDKPRRVDLYFSSWVIRPAQSLKGDGTSACEVTLVHYEDMGIPKDVAKLGVRHGMWGTVKKLHAGFRTYQTAWKQDATPSRCALMARVAGKIALDNATNSAAAEETQCDREEKQELAVTSNQQQREDGGGGGGGIDWKWVAIGGAVALACGLKTGVIGRAVLIGAGHRIARRRGNLR